MPSAAQGSGGRRFSPPRRGIASASRPARRYGTAPVRRTKLLQRRPRQVTMRGAPRQAGGGAKKALKVP